MNPTRREFLRGSLAAALSAKANFALAEGTDSANMLWYGGEAKRWLEALPVGNGRIGGMVFGGLQKERIALTESTVWSGAPSNSDVNPEGLEHINEIRRLLFQEDYVQARKICEKHLLSHPTSFGTNLPLIDLAIDLDGFEGATQYRRTLNLDEGIARVNYWKGAHNLTREVFSSNPHDILVVHLASDTTGRLNVKIYFDEPILPGKIAHSSNDTLIFRGQALETLHSKWQARRRSGMPG